MKQDYGYGMTVLGALLLAAIYIACSSGCQQSAPPYGVEVQAALPGSERQTWAVAPVINQSGQKEVDPLLQADLVYAQLQQVAGLTVIPVNRVVQVYAALRITQVQSEEQAELVCEALGCDALVVTSVTLYDPFDPPKLGVAMQLFRRGAKAFSDGRGGIDPRELAREAAPPPGQNLPTDGNFTQVVGMYDAANGSVREALASYAAGRHDPASPLGARAHMMDMDRYCAFVYHQLVGELLYRYSKL